MEYLGDKNDLYGYKECIDENIGVVTVTVIANYLKEHGKEYDARKLNGKEIEAIKDVLSHKHPLNDGNILKVIHNQKNKNINKGQKRRDETCR